MPADLFRQSKWDVVAAEEIVVHQQQPKYPWISSLWYCRLPDTTEYRWYEASHWSLVREQRVAPFSLISSPEHADLVATPIMHSYQFAFGPTAVDDENEDDFIERWTAVLAVAAQGKLGYPGNLPLRPDFWRQHFIA